MTETARKCAVRLIGGRWHRWDNFAQDWHEIGRPEVATGPAYAAREYASGFYGCSPRQVQVEPAAP